jgi:sialate O-acetylesterase
MSLEGIAADAGLMPVFARRAQMMKAQAEAAATLAQERREDQAARQAGQAPPHHDLRPDPASWAPAALFNGMVAPAVEYAIKGVSGIRASRTAGKGSLRCTAKSFRL